MTDVLRMEISSVSKLSVLTVHRKLEKSPVAGLKLKMLQKIKLKTYYLKSAGSKTRITA